MQMFGNKLHCDTSDFQKVVRRVESAAEAEALPRGTVVGDLHGGVTFSDAVARALEKRSHTGWLQMQGEALQNPWTVIVLNR